MMPLGVAGRSKYRPYATFMLIVVNTLIFLWMFLVSLRGEAALLGFVSQFALDVCRVGVEPVTASLFKGFSSLFVHASLVHLLGNMVFLWIFGPRVESYFGRRRFLVFYTLAGLGATLGHLLFGGTVCIPGTNITGYLVGASGAIAGVMGAFLFLYPGARVRTAIVIFGWLPIKVFYISAWIYLLIWVALDFVKGIGWIESVGVAHFAHVGGFVIGFLITFVATLYKPAPAVDAFERLDD